MGWDGMGWDGMGLVSGWMDGCMHVWMDACTPRYGEGGQSVVRGGSG